MGFTASVGILRCRFAPAPPSLFVRALLLELAAPDKMVEKVGVAVYFDVGDGGGELFDCGALCGVG